MNTTKIVELVIDEDSQELAIDCISLVSAPAIEENWVFFGKEKNNLTLAKVDEEKRMLISPALIPNKQIFRYDPNTDSDYYVYFSPETVRKASELYLKNNNHHKATQEHTERVSGVLTVESWIIEDTKTDKSTLYGFSLPKGTWMVKMKIENEDLWQKIKSGELKGLSIEGYFTNKFEQMQNQEPTTEEVRTALKELLSVQKVELSIFSDMVKRYDTLKQINGEVAKQMNKAKQLAHGGRGMAKDFDNIYNKAEKMAKELGVAFPDSNIKSLVGKIKDFDTYFKKVFDLF